METSPPIPDKPDSTAPPLVGGTLYLVATPIGNLEDITLRAIRTLRECDAVAAEDTRHTARLLNHFEIHKPLLSCHQFNEAKRGDELVERLRSGARIALVSDAGSPGISDPGERLVRKVLDAGLRVESVPGPCALVAALTTSGLPTREFHFCGFLPHKGAARRRLLGKIGVQRGTIVLYESPHRILKLLEDIAGLWPARQISLSREITKRFEETVRGGAKEVFEKLKTRNLRGEFVVTLAPLEDDEASAAEISPETSQDSTNSVDPEPV